MTVDVEDHGVQGWRSETKRLFASDFSMAFCQLNSDGAVFEGEYRNLWAGRIKSRLNKNQIKQTNKLIMKLMSIFKQDNKSSDENLYTMQWVLAPVESKPKRRK